MSNIVEQIRQVIERAIPGAQAEVQDNGGGHFRISVTSAAFAGKSMLEKQRMVLGSIADMMKGEGAPIHAVDQLVTKVP